jgi:hypothetical protein
LFNKTGPISERVAIAAVSVRSFGRHLGTIQSEYAEANEILRKLIRLRKISRYAGNL